MLRVLAISAPHFISKGNSSQSFSFNSKTPFSLQNALRDAINESSNVNSAWRASNFYDKTERGNAVFMMQFWEDEKEVLRQRLEAIKPNLFLIGSMTLGMPGAIAAAKLAKEILGNDVCIVLGGKHVNETFFRSKGEVINLRSSPINLMVEKKISKIFDIVVSGDGEKIITRIGEVIVKLKKRGCSVTELLRYKSYLEDAEGDWLAGQILYEDSIIYLHSRKSNFINYETLAFPTDKFELTQGFNIFKTDYTAHAYSDISKGCPYSCFFCSEKGYINGPLRKNNNMPAHRLFSQFKLVHQMQRTFHHNSSVSIFVEDSIFLGSITENIKTFCELMETENINIPFGCQFTLDTFLFDNNLAIIEKLKDFGLKYVAFGVETENETIASSFSKNAVKGKSWAEKTERVIQECLRLNLSCGMFLLWGLGETQTERIRQLQKLIFWKFSLKINIEVGLNIATQHPLRDQFNQYTYEEWGTAIDSPYLSYFIELFGEASERYKITEVNFPTISDLVELKKMFQILREPIPNYAE